MVCSCRLYSGARLLRVAKLYPDVLRMYYYQVWCTLVPSSQTLRCQVPAPSHLKIMPSSSGWPSVLFVAEIEHVHQRFLFVSFEELVSGHRDTHRSIPRPSSVGVLCGPRIAAYVKLGGVFRLLMAMPQSCFTASLISSSMTLSAAALLGPRRGTRGLCALKRIFDM